MDTQIIFKNTIIILAILGILLYLKYLTETNKCNQIENKWYQDQDEYPPDDSPKPNKKDIHYVFYTGGFDSTFLLLENLIDKKVPVQPIYLLCSDLDSESKSIQRKNRTTEINVIKKIRKSFQEKYPELAHNLLPTYYVTGVKKDKEVERKYQNLRKKFNHFKSRTICQYERLAKFSLGFDYPIEIGLEKCGTGLDKATFDKRITTQTGEVVLDPNLPPHLNDFQIFRNIQFPIAHLTKEEMVDISKKNGYYDLLEMSWSCWYPRHGPFGVYPCGKCSMCQKRVIK